MAAARKQPPDLVLLDIHLVGPQDGIAVAREILLHQQVPIVVLTANTEDETYLRAKQVFFPAAYLTKPFRHLDLPRLVDLAWNNFRPEVPPKGPTMWQDSVFLPVEKGFEKIVKSEVLYITTQKGTHCVNIFEAYKKQPRLIQLSLGYIEHYFTLPTFFRLSRSLLINLSCIEHIKGTQLKFQGSDIWITIPEGSRADLMKHLAIVRNPRK